MASLASTLATAPTKRQDCKRTHYSQHPLQAQPNSCPSATINHCQAVRTRCSKIYSGLAVGGKRLLYVHPDLASKCQRTALGAGSRPTATTTQMPCTVMQATHGGPSVHPVYLEHMVRVNAPVLTCCAQDSEREHVCRYFDNQTTRASRRASAASPASAARSFPRARIRLDDAAYKFAASPGVGRTSAVSAFASYFDKPHPIRQNYHLEGKSSKVGRAEMGRPDAVKLQH